MWARDQANCACWHDHPDPIRTFTRMRLQMDLVFTGIIRIRDSSVL